MPKIIFVSPPLSKKERYGNLASAGSYMPPLGFGFLAAVLRERGFEVKIFDCEALRLNVEQATKHILSFQPDYVGITAVSMSIHYAAEVAIALKIRNSKSRIILGGAHLSALPEDTMNLFPQFDIGVIGEGEVTLVELLNELRNNKSLNSVNGIIYRDNSDKLVRTPPRRLIENLDTLPFPAWDLYPDLKKHYCPSAFGFQKLPCTSLITSRGCPGHCSFCNQGVWGRRYREHSAEYVMEMIGVLYHKYDIRDLSIYDGTFGINQDRLIRLCEMLIKEKLNLVWSCNFRVEMAKPEILSLMKKAGCWGIAYGIESCSQEVLDFLQKGINLEMITKALKFTKEAGIISKGYIMIGTPVETIQSFHRTLECILQLDLDLLTVNSFTPFPGTLDYQRADKYGRFNRDWRLLNEHNLVFIPNGLTQKQIDYFIRLITRKFYLRPQILWKYMKMSLSPCYFKLLFNGLISFLKFAIYSPIKMRKKTILIKIPRGKVYFSLRKFWEALFLIFQGKLSSGEAITKFENEFANYIGTKYAIATSSGTISLYLCLKALGVKESDEIILPAYTVPEVVAAILYSGAKPVFIDIDPRTYNMNPCLIEERISSRTKFLLLTHIYGQPCDIDPILNTSRKYNLKIIEDVAQACGAEYKGKKVGSFGDLSYFSFGLMKNLNTLGGGAITTDNSDLVNNIRKEISTFDYPKSSELIKRLIMASAICFFTHPIPFTLFIFPIIYLLNLFNDNLLYNLLKGKKEINLSPITLPEKYRFKFTNMQAAIGLRQLKELDKNNFTRIKNARILTSLLNDLSLRIPLSLPYVKNIYLNYVIQVRNKKWLMRELLKKGIDVTEGYVENCSNLEAFKDFRTDCPVSDILSKYNLYLPIRSPLKEKHMIYIADSLKSLCFTS